MPRLVTDDMAALCDAAIAGVGVVALPAMMLWRQTQAGQLVHILPDWRPPAGIVHAVFASRRGLLPSVRTLLEFLARKCAEARRTAGELTDGQARERPEPQGVDQPLHASFKGLVRRAAP